MVKCAFDYYVSEGVRALHGVISPHTLRRLEREGKPMPRGFAHARRIVAAPSDGRGGGSEDDMTLIAYARKHRADAVQIVSRDLFRDWREKSSPESRWLAAEFDKVVVHDRWAGRPIAPFPFFGSVPAHRAPPLLQDRFNANAGRPQAPTVCSPRMGGSHTTLCLSRPHQVLCSYTILPEDGGGFDFVPQRCPERPELCADDDDDDNDEGGAMPLAEADEATDDDGGDAPSGAPATTTTAAATTLALLQPSQLLLATAPSVVSLTLEVRPPCLTPPS